MQLKNCKCRLGNRIRFMTTLPEAFALALEHHRAGRLEAAEKIYQQILAAKPNQADALHLLGLISSQRGHHAAAIPYFERAIALQGNTAFFHNNLGEAYRALGRIADAVVCYRRALALTPGTPEVHNNLGNALKGQGKLDEAAASYGRAIDLQPTFAEAHNNLGNIRQAAGNVAEAVDCYRRALELKPGYAEAHNNLGNALKDMGRPEEATAFYRRAAELRPGFFEAHGNLGHVLEEMGDLRAAEASFRAALRYNPRFAMAHCKLAELLGGELPADDVTAQRRLLEDAELPDSQRLWLHFGLARVLDARGHYAEAAEHLECGNAMQLAESSRRGQEYDPQQHEARVAQIIAACSSEFFQRVRGFGLESEVPVFIVGLPRSGTTLIEHILASHSQVFGAGEITFARDTMAALAAPGTDAIDGLRRLDEETARQIAARHLERLRGLYPSVPRIVDKMPDNYQFLGLLAVLFPRAKLIHCRRDLRDVAVSCWMTHFQDVPWANDPRHIASRIRQYQRLMAHWRTVLPAAILCVDYEETVADLESVARKLIEWCGLAWEPECLEFQRAKRAVKTASSVNVRRPVFKTSVGRWRHYVPFLAALLSECGR
jgi:tetratricopeptide (TPR) repeat protein